MKAHSSLLAPEGVSRPTRCRGHVRGRGARRGWGGVLVAAQLAAIPSVPSAALAASTVPDAWSPEIVLRSPNGAYATPVHASLMPDGRVMFVGYSRDTLDGNPQDPDDFSGYSRAAWTMTPDPVGAPFPPQTTGLPLTQPTDLNDLESDDLVVTDDFICSGHAPMADGRLLFVGGTRTFRTSAGEQVAIEGLNYASVMDGTAWGRVPGAMSVSGRSGTSARWYPTVTRLADGRMLVTSGFDLVQPQPSVNLSTEVFDPATGSFSPLSGVGQTPFAVINGDYTHAFVLPQPVGPHDVLTFGEPGVPALLSTAQQPGAWLVQGQRPRPGSEAWQVARATNGGAWVGDTAPNNGASTVMLPLRVKDGQWGYGNGSVLVAGGGHDTVHEHRADVYDPTQNAWRPSIDMGARRHHPSTVVLPDGRILVVAGHGPDAAVSRAAYVDPTRGLEVTEGATDSGVVRGYHSVSLLLPDGRVLVGGGRDVVTGDSTEKATFQYYYPHYVFAERPGIVAAPAAIGYQEPFEVATSGKRISELVLVSLGSMTHSIDMNQRSVQLRVRRTKAAAGGHAISAVGPTSASEAPPGVYMLFALDQNRIPSVARMVTIR